MFLEYQKNICKNLRLKIIFRYINMSFFLNLNPTPLDLQVNLNTENIFDYFWLKTSNDEYPIS